MIDKFAKTLLVIVPFLLFFNGFHAFLPSYFSCGIILIILSIYFIIVDRTILPFVFLGISEIIFLSSFISVSVSNQILFLTGYITLAIILRIWSSVFDKLEEELYKTSFMQNNPGEVAKTMFSQIEKKLGKCYIELSYMDFVYSNANYEDFKDLKTGFVEYPIKIFDKNVGYLKVLPLRKIGPIKSIFIKKTLDITTYWLMNVTFLSSITLLESLENFASRNDYGIIIESNGNFLYTNKYVQKNFSYIHNLDDLISVISNKYKENFLEILKNEGNDIFVIERDDMELFVGIGIEKSNRSSGDLNIIKISPITSSNINEILLYKFDTMKFKELVASLYLISTMENDDKAFKEVINIIKTKISSAKNMFIFIRRGDKFFLKSSDVEEEDIEIDESEIPDVIGPWYVNNFTLKSKKMMKYLRYSNAIITRFSDGDDLEGLLILILDENATIDKLDISIINIIVQYINIALINIVTIHKLSLVAKYDGLTGLLRRESFYDMLSYTLQMAKRTRKIFSIVYVDMDGLKFINDTYGHEYGDIALKILAETLKSNIRSSDVCARIGGDEFMVLLNDTDNPEKFVKRTKADLSSKKISDINIGISASFGYYVYDGEKDIDVETIIKKADERMYKDKKEKRN